MWPTSLMFCFLVPFFWVSDILSQCVLVTFLMTFPLTQNQTSNCRKHWFEFWYAKIWIQQMQQWNCPLSSILMLFPFNPRLMSCHSLFSLSPFIISLWKSWLSDFATHFSLQRFLYFVFYIKIPFFKRKKNLLSLLHHLFTSQGYENTQFLHINQLI